METTLSLCWFTPHLAYFAHIGDSRIYHWSAAKGKLQQMTEDDTHVGWLLRNQKITEWEARVHPGKNVLQKALGAGNLYVDVFDVLSLEGSVAARNHIGGTAPQQVRKAIARIRTQLA